MHKDKISPRVRKGGFSPGLWTRGNDLRIKGHRAYRNNQKRHERHKHQYKVCEHIFVPLLPEPDLYIAAAETYHHFSNPFMHIMVLAMRRAL